MVLYRLCFISLFLGLSLSSCAPKKNVAARIAVATNFLPTAQKLEAAFEAQTDYNIDLVSGSTGQLYSQIINGAPYDVFLSADAARVTHLLTSGHAVDGTRMTYALGQLVLYGENAQERLKAGVFNGLAMANPDLAPYGMAAEEVLEHMQLSGFALDKTVYGQNVGQAYGFVKTGNTDLGFVALSQMDKATDNYWIIPKNYYGLIWQDGVLLSFGENNIPASVFLNYLKTPQAKRIIQASGYEVPTHG